MLDQIDESKDNQSTAFEVTKSENTKPASQSFILPSIGKVETTNTTARRFSFRLLSIYFIVLVFILLFAAIFCTERGYISIGIEKAYGAIGLERVWGGLSENPSLAVSQSFTKMSKAPNFKFDGTLQIVTNRDVSSPAISPFLPDFGTLLSLSDSQLGVIDRARLTSTDSSAITVTLTSNVSEVPSGGSATISWVSENATKCRADWNGGSEALSGSILVNNFTYNRGFEMTCIRGSDTLFDPLVNYSQDKVLSNLLIVPLVGVSTLPAPTLTITADQTIVSAGGNVVLYWSSANATSCSADWTTATGVSGSQSILGVTTTTAYSMTCSGPGGSAIRTVTILVNKNPLVASPISPSVTSSTTPIVAAVYPSVTLSADNTYVDYHGTITLSWSSKNADNCSANWTKKTAKSGSETLSNLEDDATYTITCKRADGNAASNSVKVIVGRNTGSSSSVSANSQSSNKVPTVVLSTNKASVNVGDKVVITWKSQNADRCVATWTAQTAASGQEVVLIEKSSDYHIYCFNGTTRAKSNDLVVTLLNEGQEGVSSAPAASYQLSLSFLGESSGAGSRANFDLSNSQGAKSTISLKNSDGNLWVKSNDIQFDEAMIRDKWLEYPIATLGKGKYFDKFFATKINTSAFAAGSRIANEKCGAGRCYRYQLTSLNSSILADAFGFSEPALLSATGDVSSGINDKLIKSINLNLFFDTDQPVSTVKLSLNFRDYGVENTYFAPTMDEIVIPNIVY